MTAIGILAALLVGLIVAGAVFLFVPFIIGASADAVGGSVTGRRLNLGCLGYIVIAVLGSFVGHALMRDYGPEIFGISIIPAFVGSLIVTIILSVVLNFGRRRY